MRKDGGAVTGVIEIGGGHAAAAIVRDDRPDRVDGPLVAAPIDGGADRESLLEAMLAPVRTRLQAPTGAVPGRWIAAVPGPFDYAEGIGRFQGVGKFESLRGVSLRDEFAHRLGLEPGQLRFVNDAVAYGVGEWAFGDSGRPDRLVCITLGTGVGSSFLDRGIAVDSGDTVPRLGEVHHLTVEGRPLEESVSTRAITGRYRRATGEQTTVKEIARRARAGEAAAAEVISTAMTALGGALAPWIARFEASHLAVGGSFVLSWDVFGPPLRAAVHGLARSPVAVLPSTRLDTAPVLGAAFWLRRQLSLSDAPVSWSENQ